MYNLTKKSKKIRKNTKLISFIEKNFKMFLLFLVSVIVIFSILLIFKSDENNKVLTINGIKYTESDFMMYLYSTKYNYFNGNLDINEDDLNAVMNEENITVREYLKENTINDIKTSTAILYLASDNNIKLTNKDYEELDKEKKDFINKLGGKKKFKKFLKTNNTNEESYDKMSEIDKLYNKILKDLYGKDKVRDLSDDEYKEAKKNYKKNYVKIKQIILTTIDIETGKSLSEITIKQKNKLANAIISDIKNDISFDSLIKEYSEDAIEKEAPYDVYYKKGELLPELEKVAFEIEVEEVSKPIKTNYAIHIIQKQKLDDNKLNDYYDDLREEKCIKDLGEYLGNLKIVYHDSYGKISIK